DVGPSECLSLPVTAARVRQEHEVTGGGKLRTISRGGRPAGPVHPRWPAMHTHHHRIALIRLVIAPIHEPPLDRIVVTFPADALGFTPARPAVAIGLRHLLPVADRPGPDFGRLPERMPDDAADLAIARQRYARQPRPALHSGNFGPRPQCRDLAASRIER